jgi:hypothetical protein
LVVLVWAAIASAEDVDSVIVVGLGGGGGGGLRFIGAFVGVGIIGVYY